MSFVITTDASSNLTGIFTKKYDIRVVPLTYIVNGLEQHCNDVTEHFNGNEYYEMIKNADVKTSTVSIGQYMDIWEPILESGQDILHLTISSGISGAYNAGRQAAQMLKEDYPDRKIVVFDTLAASLGEGIQVIYAARLKDQGKDINEIIDALVKQRDKTVQVFSVDDLNFLKKGGRISAAAAAIGSVLHIKPILKGNYMGQIVVSEKVRGRRTALEALAEDFAAHFDKNSSAPVGIAHAGCEEDANFLVSLLKKVAPAAEFVLTMYEPVTGSHVGPGAIALFYTGDARFV